MLDLQQFAPRAICTMYICTMLDHMLKTHGPTLYKCYTNVLCFFLGYSRPYNHKNNTGLEHMYAIPIGDTTLLRRCSNVNNVDSTL